MTILDTIVEKKWEEIEKAKAAVPLSQLQAQIGAAPPVRDFRQALEQTGGVAIIAEVKKASPSAGVIREDFDPVGIARTYAEHGASCISVLTDQHFFQGDLQYLTAIRREVSLPLLRKDFLLDPYQVFEARAAGADAILLIAEILDKEKLKELLTLAEDLGMQALVELYEADNLPLVLESGARLIGINNRNLKTFVTTLDHTIALAGSMPNGVCLVSESGIRSYDDVERLQAAGAKAVLVGETLMRALDIGQQLRALRGH